MKFTWFNLMPWPYLPDDFREKHRSVWVDIPNTLIPGARVEMLDAAAHMLPYEQPQAFTRAVAGFLG